MHVSQHDQSILEEEYGLNDRPDKYARREIMKRVDLGEREIQVSHAAFRSMVSPN